MTLLGFFTSLAFHINSSSPYSTPHLIVPLLCSRGKVTFEGGVELVHNIMDPVKLGVDLKRALRPYVMHIRYDVTGKMHNVDVGVSFLACTKLLYKYDPDAWE